MHNRKEAKLVCLLLIVLGTIFVNSSFNAQEGSKSDPRRPLGPEKQIGSSSPNSPYFSPKEPVSCEIAGVYMDDAAARTKNIEDSYLIVIARLGDREQSRQLNRRRLDEVKRYMKRHPSAKLVTAEGQRVQGYGRLELYVSGKLLYTLPIRRNAEFNLHGCIFV